MKVKSVSKEKSHEIELEVRGMTCDSCAVHVKNALESVPDVLSASVPHWTAGEAAVKTRDGVIEDRLVSAVKAAGYSATLRSPTREFESLEPDNRSSDYDLIVIGTGCGGMAAALKASELGKSVLVVEAGTIGGTCVNIGCVPSKTLIRAAEVYHKAKNHPFKGIDIQTNGVNWHEVVKQKDGLVDELREQKYANVLASQAENITFMEGSAEIKGGGVVVDGEHYYSAKKIVIAVGARPNVLPLEGIDNVNVLTSTTIMSLEKQPGSLVIIGGRAIALELGQALARLGTKVTILQRSDRLIPDHEPEISEAIQEYLQNEGLDIYTGVSAKRIKEEKGRKIVTVAKDDGFLQDFQAEEVLMAVGREPNSQDLGLEEAGVETDEGGFILVDDTLQTTNPHIYAVGDVTTLPKLVYVAAAAGGIAASHAFGDAPQPLDLSVLPQVIFTDPQIAIVGLTETRATEKGYQVKTTLLPLDHVPRALAARDTRGFIKLVADEATDRLLGAHILAAEGGELVQTAALAVKFGVTNGFTLSDLRQMFFPYLTQVEGLKLAAQTFEKDVTQLSCCAG
ncbi:MAG: mercury(II) reductase [Candidatus Neomarinimicrobiota bacterium]